MKNMNLDLFSQYLGERFSLQGAGSMTTKLELIEVKDLSGAQTAKKQSFSLVFQGFGEMFLSQKTYSLCHEKIGIFDLFLVPIGQDATGFRYEAVFN